MTDDAERPLRFRKGPVATPEPRDGDAWNILIVDDDEGVHSVTKLVLRNKEIFGIGIALHSAYSAEECKRLLARRNDIAVILLDVVMERDDAGLLLVRWIREELGNSTIRIILRTGQPGKAPESNIITHYEINDYKEKTELTYEKLWSCVVTAVRGYRDITIIEQSRAGMEMILKAAPRLFQFQSLKLLASGVLTQLISILNLGRDATPLGYSGFSALLEDGAIRILAGSGRFAGLADDEVLADIGEKGMRQLVESTGTDGFVVDSGNLAMCAKKEGAERPVIFIEGCVGLGELEKSLLALFLTNVAAAFANLELYGELETRLAEKTLLIHEIHHRVKNNLQIISSLIELGDVTHPESMMESLRRRISTLAIIHDRLSFVADGKSIDFAETVADIVSETASRARVSAYPEIRRRADSFAISLDTAIPCALIVEELLSGAISDFRPGTPIDLTLDSGEEGRRSVVFGYSSVSGKLPLSEDCLVLVNGLASQIHGKFESSLSDGIMTMSLVFSIRPAQPEAVRRAPTV